MKDMGHVLRLTVEDTITSVPFAIPSQPDDEGVYLPDGKEFNACVHMQTKQGHLDNCETGKNDGHDVIGVYIPLMPDTETTPVTEMGTMNMSGMDMK